MTQRASLDPLPGYDRDGHTRGRWSPLRRDSGRPGPRGTTRRSSAWTPGFTLLELTVVAAIVSFLAALALPYYRRAVAVAEASSRILETVAFAEQCAVAQKSGLHVVVSQPGGGSANNCDGTAARQINSRRWSGDAAGVLCLGRIAQDNHRQATFLVAVNGTVNCTFLP